MDNSRIYKMSFTKVYPLYVTKALRKGRTKEEVDTIMRWLTGYSEAALEKHTKEDILFVDFFENAPEKNPHRTLITGTVCGVKIAEIKDPLMLEIRYLDKLIDELAKGKPIEKILRNA